MSHPPKPRGVRVGVDLGGTKIEAIALGDDDSELARRRVPTPRGDYGGTLEAVAALVEDVERAAGGRASAIGVATPGALSPDTGLIKNANSTCLIGRPLDADLSRRLGRPVRLANDANCLALSEAAAGDAAARETMRRYHERLARALAHVLNILDPDVVVLGGGVSNVRSLCEEVPRLWGRWVFSDAVRTRLARAKHGDSSGVRGAAWLWPKARD